MTRITRITRRGNAPDPAAGREVAAVAPLGAVKEAR